MCMIWVRDDSKHRHNTVLACCADSPQYKTCIWFKPEERVLCCCNLSFLCELQRLSYDGDDPSMYDSPLSSCRAATCWRGACDAFMYFENRRLEECTHAVEIVANLHVPQNRPVGFGLRNYTIREKHQIQ